MYGHDAARHCDTARCGHDFACRHSRCVAPSLLARRRRWPAIAVARPRLVLLLWLLTFVAAAGEPPKQSLRLNQSVAPGMLQAAVPQATLRFYSRGDIPNKSDRKYLPPGKVTEVELKTNLGREPHIRHLLWQVSRAPFYGPLDKPVGLVASGHTDDRVFTLKVDTFYQRPALQGTGVRNAPQKQLREQPENGDKPTLHRLQTAPSMQRTEPARPVQLHAGVRQSIELATPLPPASFYVRVIPYDTQRKAIVGKPSLPLQLIMAEEPDPDTDMSTFNTVSSQRFDIRLVEFRYVPTVRIEQWPRGCTPIPRDEGKDALDVISEAPGAVVDLVNWASDAYRDIKEIAVSVVAALLPFVPESVISIALDAAMAAAGVPPSIPNVDQLMSGGADYLATQMAEQIPIPASGALAEMAVGEAREEIRQRTRQALLETADKLAEQQRRESKWCRSYTSEPYFEITIRNAGPNAADDFTLSVSNSGDLLETTHVHIEHMDAGQRFTIPIAYRQNQNISYRWLSQIPSKDREKAELEWWMSYQTTPISFGVNVTEKRDCRGDGSCDETRRTLLNTPTRLWDNDPAYRRSGN